MSEVLFEDYYSEEAQAFYTENQHVSISNLLFKYGSNPQKKAWSLQLESRRRAAQKLPTWLANPKIVFPPKLNLEQASSEITAKYKANIVDFKTSLDLTAGTGIDSWQLTLKSQNHTAVEPNKDLIALTTHNFGALKIESTFFCCTAEEFLAQNQRSFDLIFIDPSRRTETGGKVVLLENYSPNVVALKERLLELGKRVLIKVSPFADISYLVNLFENSVKEVHVVAVNNECKEILLLLTNKVHRSPRIKTVNFTAHGDETFEFDLQDEEVKSTLADDVKPFVYEPNVAVLKAGAFNTIATKFNLQKFDPSSHLYTSDEIRNGFPGKIYKLIEVSAPFKLKENYQNVSIATRNFPDKPDNIRKRLKAKEGNDYKIFATTLGGNKVFVVGTILDAH